VLYSATGAVAAVIAVIGAYILVTQGDSTTIAVVVVIVGLVASRVTWTLAEKRLAAGHAIIAIPFALPNDLNPVWVMAAGAIMFSGNVSGGTKETSAASTVVTEAPIVFP